MECEDNVDDIIMPKMILQPLVENCFEHAFKEILPPWVLHIKVYREDNLLVIAVRDNGKGIEEDRLQELRECLDKCQPLEKRKGTGVSIGIINVMQRIDMVCLEGSRIEIASKPGEGTEIFVKIVLGD